MKLDVFTLFPEHFEWFGSQRHVRNAIEGGSELRFFNYRDTTPLGAGQVDDSPYGGGAGMVMRVDVVDAALEAAYGEDRSGVRAIALTPGGRSFDEELAAELAAEPHLALLCGRYEGFDERVVEHLADDAVSIGPLRALRGRAAGDGRRGRGPAQASRARSATPRARSRSPSARRSRATPEYPHYTRPPEYRGWGVPEILLSGDHAKVREWRLARSRERAG